MNFRRVFFVTFLAVQILVPLVQAFGPKPTRFAWQMFSGTSVPLRIQIRTVTEVRDIDVSGMVGNWRGDLNLEKYLPPFMCKRFPEASSVLLFYIESDQPQEFPCQR